MDYDGKAALTWVSVLCNHLCLSGFCWTFLMRRFNRWYTLQSNILKKINGSHGQREKGTKIDVQYIDCIEK